MPNPVTEAFRTFLKHGPSFRSRVTWASFPPKKHWDLGAAVSGLYRLHRDLENETSLMMNLLDIHWYEAQAHKTTRSIDL